MRYRVSYWTFVATARTLRATGWPLRAIVRTLRAIVHESLKKIQKNQRVTAMKHKVSHGERK
eukprot:1194815-Prorocentrum_minimum.AAC.3